MDSDEVPPGTEHGGLGSASASGTTTSADTEPSKRECSSSRSGSLNSKHEVLSGFLPIDDWSRAVKAAKIDGGVDSPATTTTGHTKSFPMMMRLSSSAAAAAAAATATTTTTVDDPVSSDTVFRQQQQQRNNNVLSFSPCSKSAEGAAGGGLSYLPPPSPPPHMVAKNASGAGAGGVGYHHSGYLLGGIAAGGPFTASQWLELEQQALIYKYITANEPIPHHLLIPIRKALESAAGFFYTGGGHLLKPNWGCWGGGCSDPEPGRCRRTDGKKWRCARDAVPDQKYCERHMNRGRHRSRKHVEGGGGLGNAKINTTSTSNNGHSGTTNNMKLVASSSPSSSNGMLGGGTGGGSSSSNSLDLVKNFQSASSDPLIINRMMLGNRDSSSSSSNRDSSTTQLLSFLPPQTSINLNTSAAADNYSIPNITHYHHRPCEQSNPVAEFGLGPIFSTTNSFSPNINQAAAAADHHATLLWPAAPRTHTTTSNHQHQSSNLPLLWPTGLHHHHPQQDYNTQLSISSLPMDFMSSSTSSPINHEKPTSLGVVGLETTNYDHYCCEDRQAPNWVPISWEGGPLGEVLQSTNNPTTNTTSSTSHPNKLPTGWWDTPTAAAAAAAATTGQPQQQQLPQPGWSPTGVLQRSALVSLSNSSAGSSSPRADNSSRVIESGGGCFSLCN